MNGEAVVLDHPNGVIRFWSGGAETLFGYSTSEAIGQTLDLIVPPEYREAHWRGFRRALASGTASAEGQMVPFPAQHANRAIMTRSGRLTLVRRPRGEVIAALVGFE